MAYNSSYSSGNYGRQSYGSRPQQQRPSPAQQTQAEEIRAEALPAEYVDSAEQVMRKVMEEGSRITTSKIRNLLSLVSDICNAENIRTEAELLPESITSLMMMRIRVVYEAGREPSVRAFVKEVKILEYLKDIGKSREKLINFAHYMEALVAYHRFFGGKES